MRKEKQKQMNNREALLNYKKRNVIKVFNSIKCIEYLLTYLLPHAFVNALSRTKLTYMLSKIVHFFDRPKKDLFGEFSDRNKNYGKFMEWQDDDDDRKSICSLSWSGKNFLGRSKSESSINVTEDCNYKTQGTQVSLKSCNTAKNVTSILENFNLRNDDSDDIIDDDVPTMIIDYPTYNQYDYGYQYGIKTKDVTTKEIVMQKPEILNFQGNRHVPDEIAPYWKKDCRMWLWKSVRLAHKKNPISVVYMSKN